MVAEGTGEDACARLLGPLEHFWIKWVYHPGLSRGSKPPRVGGLNLVPSPSVGEGQGEGEWAGGCLPDAIRYGNALALSRRPTTTGCHRQEDASNDAFLLLPRKTLDDVLDCRALHSPPRRGRPPHRAARDVDIAGWASPEVNLTAS